MSRIRRTPLGDVEKPPVMSPGHQTGGDPALSLAHTTVPQEVVAVHDCQLVQKELDGALTPPLVWTFALRETRNLTVTASTVYTLP